MWKNQRDCQAILQCYVFCIIMEFYTIGESADYDMLSSLRRVATIDPPMGCYSSNIDLLRGDEALHEYETIVEKPASMMEEALKSIFLIDNIFVCMLVAVEYMQFERYYTRSRRRV